MASVLIWVGSVLVSAGALQVLLETVIYGVALLAGGAVVVIAGLLLR